PLAGPDAAEHDVDIVTRLKSGETYHAFGEIDDLDRLSHVQNVNRNVSALLRHRMSRSRDHEIAGFANGHEIADHVRMRDRHRSAGLDLRLEFRHHRSV